MRAIVAFLVWCIPLPAMGELYVCLGPERQIMRSDGCENNETVIHTYGTRNVRFVRPRLFQPSRDDLEEVPRATTYKAGAFVGGGGGVGCSSAIESRIDGEFKGWEGETLFKLMNGQIWQQTSYDYNYHYSYMPKVTIFRSSGGCKLQVDGVSRAISVEQLK